MFLNHAFVACPPPPPQSPHGIPPFAHDWQSSLATVQSEADEAVHRKLPKKHHMKIITDCQDTAIKGMSHSGRSGIAAVCLSGIHPHERVNC